MNMGMKIKKTSLGMILAGLAAAPGRGQDADAADSKILRQTGHMSHPSPCAPALTKTGGWVRRDSNPYLRDFKSLASAGWATDPAHSNDGVRKHFSSLPLARTARRRAVGLRWGYAQPPF